MSPRPKRGWFPRTTAAFVSAALVASSLAPGTTALAADVQAVPTAAADRAITRGSAASTLRWDAAIPLALAPSLGSPALNPVGVSPSALSAPALAPSPLSVIPDLSGHIRPSAAVPAPAIVPAAEADDAGAEHTAADAVSPAAPDSASGEESLASAKSRADEAFRKLTGEAPARYLHESFLGFRRVRGVAREPALGRLPAGADASRVVDQIAGQFGLARGEVLSLARGFRLDEASPRAEWLAVYDRLQAANRDHFKRLDSKKYHGWSSFRELADRRYPPGWRGTMLRLSELHKHFIGAFVRFPYHLFDQFVFGYFRQAVSFEFFHSGEDFLALAKDKDGKPHEGLARKWLEASLREQSFRGSGALGRLRSRPWVRQAERWIVTPVVKPLATFLARRLTLAVMSAVAMGLLGAFAPVLPLSFALTAIPYLGPGIVLALNGLPVAAAAVPLAGPVLAPVAAAAAAALAKDLVLGPLLNTMVLSTLLTFPAAVGERLAEARDRHPLSKLSAGEVAGAFARAAASGGFWRANLKSFAGMATVGAEIEGIMTYAGVIDSAIDPGVEALTGRKLGLFHAIGSAVERPEGESSIPFGGAITWGSTLLYKLQEATGLHISDAVMGAARGAASLAGLEGRAGPAGAEAVFHAASSREGAGDPLPFDPDLWKKPPEEAAARIKELSSRAGGLEAEIAAVKERRRALRAQIGEKRAELAALEKRSKPVSPEEEARLEGLRRRLADKRDESYIQSKLAERSDLLNPKDVRTHDELKRLKALQDKYRTLLPPPPDERAGYWDELVLREASYGALASRLMEMTKDEPERGDRPVSTLSPDTHKKIVELVDEIERLRAGVQDEMAERDATRNLLRAANKVRNKALRERRGGGDMLNFHRDFAKLSTVMDLALSLNEIAAAEAAIEQMKALLEAKRQAVSASQTQNQQDQAAADANSAQIAQWKADAQSKIDQDKSAKSDIEAYEDEAALAAQRAAEFQQSVSGLISGINASDGGSASDAAAQYRSWINMLPQVAEWRTNGNPNDSAAFSLKGFNDNLTEVNGYLSQAQSGLSQIATMPVEYAGTLVVLVPGPSVGVSNPTKAQTLQILSDRKTYWQGQLATYQGRLDQVERMMDSSYVMTDEFGLKHGYNQSVANMSALHESNPTAGSKADAQKHLAQLDAIASELNSVTGSNVPLLSGLSLTDLQAEIQTYGDKLRAVKFPAGQDTTETFQAKMDLILAAQLTPMAARAIINWSVDQATIDAFTKAKASGGALTAAQSGLRGVVDMLNAVISDVDKDVEYVNTGSGGGQTLIDRKTALLQNTVVPALTQAQSMLNTLISYQNDAIKQVASDSSGQYYQLFTAEQTLLTCAVDLYNKTMPWALASFGGSSDDVAGSLSSIDAWKAKLQKYIDGYDDASGHHAGVAESQKDMVDRQCQSGCTRTETLYGEVQPYSLPMKISQYNAETAQRASEINDQDAQVNEIIAKIKSLSGGKYDLSAYGLPTGLGTDAASAAKVQALADAGTISALGAKLKDVASQAQAAGGSATVSLTGEGTVQSGTQPSPTLNSEQQIALLALAAAERLVPNPNNAISATNAPAAYAVARYLYSSSVASAAQDALTNQVPKAVQFLDSAAKALGGAISQTAQDAAYVNSNGSSETADAVYARKTALFQSLDSFLKEAMAFYGLKTSWDQDSLSTIDKIETYYDSLSAIYAGGQTVNSSEIAAIDAMVAALQSTYDSLEETRQKLESWMSQLNPKEESALRRVSDDVSKVMEKTRAVLDANSGWHDLQDKFNRSREIISAGVAQVDERQRELSELLSGDDAQGQLPAELVRRIEALRLGRGSWEMGDKSSQAQALVIKKSEYSAFVDALLGVLTQGTQSLANQDLSAIKSDLLNNPQGLSVFIQGSEVMDYGDNADGFYIVYQSKFSVPNGLETGTSITLGNIGNLWGNNVSVNGYAFFSPPSSDGTNAPYGDKGVEVQVESLQGRGWVNYLNVDFHRFLQDIPAENTVSNTVGESRLMVFDDYAMMLLGDKLYVGLAGYGDVALDRAGDHPYYYGGNFKSSLKLTEVMSLDARQQYLFAHDPRSFREDVNLDFTGYDPSLNQTYTITAEGATKTFSRTEVGPRFDLNRLMNRGADGGGTFTLDIFYANTRGTDDISQQSAGATVINGFSLQRDGKPWLNISNRATGELGAESNTLADQLTFTLPGRGIALSVEGKIVGGESAHYAEVSKRISDSSALALGYGSRYVGENDRLSISMNTTFTLAQLWQSVVDRSAETLRGGETLDDFNKDIGEFFKASAKDSRAVAELQRVFEADVARKLITQDIGTLTRDIQDLRKAGAFLDNTRIRGMVGFTSNAASNDTTELASGGGFTAGTYTEIALTKSQKALVADKAVSLYREGLRLQDRLIAAVKDWQEAVVDLAQAQWDVRLAAIEAARAPSVPVRNEAEVRLSEARGRLSQALLSYNALTGRDPSAGSPFPELDAEEIETLLGNIRALVAAPDRYEKILRRLDKAELEKKLGPEPFNVVDWLPWVDRLSLGVGVQYQDMMDSQAMTLGASVRLPIYDPSRKGADRAYRLEAQAVSDELLEVSRRRGLTAELSAERARAWAAGARVIENRVKAAADRLGASLRAYRNGLIGPTEFRADADAWRFYARASLETQSQASLADAQAAVDAAFVSDEPRPSEPLRVSSIEDAFALASANSRDLSAVAARSAAAEEMARAEDHRIRKFWLDIGVGTGLTAQGLGWIPSIDFTGIPITPILGFELKPGELRELQVRQHERQKDYYDALKTRLEAGLAVQFYQEIVAYRAAEESVKHYDSLLPRLQDEADGRRIDEARLGRERAILERDRALATLNFLLGRDEKAPLRIDIDPSQALVSLRRLLAAKDIVSAQKRILDARVEVSRAVEEMVDKDLKVQMLQLEPVSIVVRSLGRIIGALSDGPVYNPDNAAAARVQTLADERARDAYDAQRAALEARLRLRLDRARVELDAVKDEAAPEAALKGIELRKEIDSLEAGLLAVGGLRGAEVGAPPAPPRDMPRSWTELTRRLASAERALAPAESEGAPEIPAPEVDAGRSGAYVRYDYAKQTLGHVPIEKSYIEGWIELRLKDPGTPPEVLLELARLRQDKAERLYLTRLAGASSRAEVFAEGFASDARLRRWLARDGDGDPRLAGLRRQLDDRLETGRRNIVALLGLPEATPLDGLLRLVPEDSVSGGLQADADRLISEIRARQIDSVRRTLFEGGLPVGFGSDDDIISQIKANTIAERMSYKGFTPVAAIGIFRDTKVEAGFIEAPDPRAIERALENVVSDALRKQLESDGRLRRLSLNLHRLMSRVEDGARELEARRALVESAEGDLRARAALAARAGEAAAPKAIEEVQAAQRRLIDAWGGFAEAVVDVKSSFVAFVAELEAMSQSSAGTLRPMPSYEARSLRVDARGQLLDFWAERLADPAFQETQDVLLAKVRPAVSPAARARIEEAARLYRQALRDAEALRARDYSPAGSFALLVRNDVEGKRLALRAAVADALGGLAALDPRLNPAAAELVEFFRIEALKAAGEGKADRAAKLAMAGELRESFWRGAGASAEAEAAYRRLAELDGEVENARGRLFGDYLERSDDPTRFVMRSKLLDEYLKAQKAFDDELVKTAEDPAFQGDAAAARVLDAMHDVRAGLRRSFDAARHGRGMAALDALIMLEEGRLRAVRWSHRPPAEVDLVAEALQRLLDMRARWENGKTEVEPIYALARRDGDNTTLTVDDWLTASEFQRMLRADPADGDKPDAIIEIGGRYYLNHPSKPPVAGARYEVIGGVDAAQALRDGARKALTDNRAKAALIDAMEGADFIALGGPDPARQFQKLSFDDVFSPKRSGESKLSLYAAGRLFFFESPRANAKSQAALNPIQALSRPPEDVVIKLYGGAEPLPRDRFPTLRSLEQSEEAGDFRTLEVSPSGAEKLRGRAREHKAAQERRGWIEVKLNSFGFARDERGRLVQLYAARDDFEAQWKSFDNAERDLADARRSLEAARVEQAALEAKSKKAREEFDSTMRNLQQDRGAKQEQRGFDDSSREMKKADEALRLARARTVNAEKAARDAETELARSKTWTLYRADDLALSFDEPAGAGKPAALVRASAPPARIPESGPLPLDEPVGTGGPAVRTLTGGLAAAVLDERGLLVREWDSGVEADEAAAGWRIVSYRPDGDVDARVGEDRVKTKVRISHYADPASLDGEGRPLPVIVSVRYLISRLDASRSKLKLAENWAIMPYNWGSIVLEIPRELVQAPIEIAGGRNLSSQHYLGRAMMYKTEGGETRHGFFRSVLGWVDVLNLLPDPVARFYDPSQFPDEVQINAPLKPGEILAQKHPRSSRDGGEYDVHFGRQSMARAERAASEDLEAVRLRTLARFNGGFEEILIETRRGRAGVYHETSVRLRGAETLAADLMAAGDDENGSAASVAPGALFVDRVERRARAYPGAEGYERQAAAMDGYGDRVKERGADLAGRRPALEKDETLGQKKLEDAVANRDIIAREERRLWAEWRELAARIDLQREIERRITAVRAEIGELEAESAWWGRYLGLLDGARRRPGEAPGPSRPGAPHGAFWAWVFVLFGLAALLAAVWHVWRARRFRPA